MEHSQEPQELQERGGLEIVFKKDSYITRDELLEFVFNFNTMGTWTVF